MVPQALLAKSTLTPLHGGRDSGRLTTLQPWLGRHPGGTLSLRPYHFHSGKWPYTFVSHHLKGPQGPTPSWGWDGPWLCPHPDPGAQKGGPGWLGTVAGRRWWRVSRFIFSCQANGALGLGLGPGPSRHPEASGPEL